jgi:hypothetical protein
LNITTRTEVCCTSGCSLNRMPNIVVNRAPGMNGAIVNYPAPGFSGSCGVVTSDPLSGSFFPIGITTVFVKGTRQDGSTTIRNFSVTVVTPTTTVGSSQAAQSGAGTRFR